MNLLFVMPVPQKRCTPKYKHHSLVKEKKINTMIDRPESLLALYLFWSLKLKFCWFGSICMFLASCNGKDLSTNPTKPLGNGEEG